LIFPAQTLFNEAAGYGAGRQGIHLLDAPVSGGVPRAREGTLAILVGENARYLSSSSALTDLGTQIFYMGEHVCRHLTKALNNLLSSITLASAIEAVLVGKRYGLDPTPSLQQ